MTRDERNRAAIKKLQAASAKKKMEKKNAKDNEKKAARRASTDEATRLRKEAERTGNFKDYFAKRRKLIKGYRKSISRKPMGFN